MLTTLAGAIRESGEGFRPVGARRLDVHIRIGGLAFGPDGRRFGCQRALRQIVAFNAHGQMTQVVGDTGCNDLVILHDGTGFYTDPANRFTYSFQIKTNGNPG